MDEGCFRPRRLAGWQVLDMMGLTQDGTVSEIEDLSSDEDDDNPVVPAPVQVPNSSSEPAQERQNEDTDSDSPSDETETEMNAEQFEMTEKKDIRWSQLPFCGNTEKFQPREPADQDVQLLSPYQYFKRYIPDELFQLMADMTNLYATQNHTNKFHSTTSNEMEVLVGLHMTMGTLKSPRVRMYWASGLVLKVVEASNMSRDRFFKLRSNWHFVNNLERPADNNDTFYKVRPLFDSIRQRCQSLEMEEEICVDEQMVPFTGTLNVKQYVKGKPHPWGVKVFVLCGESGIAYDFLIYQGSRTELSPAIVKRYGQGAAVVLHLYQRISLPFHRLFFDNYFTTFNLLEVLLAKKIFAAGTARLNRFSNPPLKSDRQLAKQRGSFDQVTSSRGAIVLVKWYDNRLCIADSRANKPAQPSRKRGRPSSLEQIPTDVVMRNAKEVHANSDILTDGIDHMPEYDNKKEATRCKRSSCTFKTHVYCDK